MITYYLCILNHNFDSELERNIIQPHFYFSNHALILKELVLCTIIFSN